MEAQQKKRVLSMIQPTGTLHPGQLPGRPEEFCGIAGGL